MRHYSLTNNSNNNNSYEITVKHVSDGKMSGYLHNADIGTILSIKPAFGSSIIDKIGEKDYVSISGGVGLTYGLLNTEYVASCYPEKSVKIIYSTQSKDTEIFRDRIKSFVKKQNNFYPTVFYSRDEIGNDSDGIVKEYQGRVDKKGLDTT
ncbi:MAG: FAD-binding oxidoreductase [Candidatus Rickettsia vulgarisii]